jgi:RNA polymerase sigma-70 factor, ECF subfamily
MESGGCGVYEPEPALVRAASTGDTDAFAELVRAYQGPVQRFLRHLLGDATLAEDVAQETFVRAYQRMASFRSESKFSTWVFSIARNAGVDAVRARGRRLRLVDRAPTPSPAVHPEASAELAAALAGLPTELREPLLLVEVLGLTYREAADVLTMPEGTVKSRVFRARQVLVAWYDDKEHVREV